ncbi:MAG: hypothetical protein KA198_01685 [Chitinophagaceae bacterium]|nr:hypothetical protein [Chitinophagaceae bacterium]
MKFFLAISAILVLFTSCSKDFTCVCTFPNNASKDFEVTLEKMKKNDAKVTCDDYSVFVGNCALK